MHVFGYKGSIAPDYTALPAGTTTVLDTGSKTRVLALINIVGAGMVGEPAESNTLDMEPETQVNNS